MDFPLPGLHTSAGVQLLGRHQQIERRDLGAAPQPGRGQCLGQGKPRRRAVDSLVRSAAPVTADGRHRCSGLPGSFRLGLVLTPGLLDVVPCCLGLFGSQAPPLLALFGFEGCDGPQWGLGHFERRGLQMPGHQDQQMPGQCVPHRVFLKITPLQTFEVRPTPINLRLISSRRICAVLRIHALVILSTSHSRPDLIINQETPSNRIEFSQTCPRDNASPEGNCLLHAPSSSRS